MSASKKPFYRGGHFKMTASKNILISEGGRLKVPAFVNRFWRGAKVPASVNKNCPPRLIVVINRGD